MRARGIVHRFPKFIALAGAALGLQFCAARAGDLKEIELPQTPPPSLEQPWQFNLSVPGWVPFIWGRTGLGGVTSDVNIDPGQLLRHLNMIASVDAEVQYGRYGAYANIVYLDDRGSVPIDHRVISKADFRLQQLIADFGVSYRLVEGKNGWLDLDAGFRYYYLYNAGGILPNGAVISQRTESIINDIGDALSRRLSDVGAAQGVITKDVISKVVDGLPGQIAKDSTFEQAPQIVKLLGGRNGSGLGDAVLAAVGKKLLNQLAVAVRSLVQAKTSEEKAAAAQEIDSLKSKISDRIAARLESALNQSASFSESWFDPYIGIEGRWNLNKPFYLTTKVDIGGFGIGSEITWEGYGALGCQLTRNMWAEAGYRYLYVDYHGGNQFLYDISIGGPQITMGITF